MKEQQNRVLIIILVFLSIMTIPLTHLNIKKSIEIIELNETIDKNGKDYQEKLKDRDQLLSDTKLALKTSVHQSDLLSTLITLPREEWNVELILKSRELFDSVPYGSHFKHGHRITAEFNSRSLVGSYWGPNGHTGVDVQPLDENGDILPNDGLNEPIYAIMDGRVVTWGRNDRTYGNYLIIESLDKKYQIKLAHLNSIGIILPNGSIDLKEGLEFTRGTRIARMGNTGRVTGPHLHLEYYMIKPDKTYRLLNASTIIKYAGE